MYSFSIYEADPKIKTVKPVRGLERQEIPECRDQQYALQAAQAELSAYVDDVCARNGFSVGDVIYCVLHSPTGDSTLQREVGEDDLPPEGWDDEFDEDFSDLDDAAVFGWDSEFDDDF
jgi:hypothetical protein